MLHYKFFSALIIAFLLCQLGSGQVNKEAVEASYMFDVGDGTFPAGQPLLIRFRLKNNTPRTLKGFVAGSISNDSPQVVHTYEKYLELAPGQIKTLDFSYSARAAGLYKVYTRYRNSLGTMAAQSIQMIYAPEKINPPLSRKKDFQAFWKASLKTLDAIRPEFKVIPKSELSTDRYKVYLVEMRSFGGALIRAWYRVPSKPGRHPAILQLPSLGGSFYNIKSLLEKPRHGVPYDFAVLSLNIRGHGNSKEDLDLGENYKDLIAYRLESREAYFYRGALLDCIRALDFLSNRSEIDQSRIAVEGGSQGGALSLMTAALDRRVRLCAPDVPFLSDIDELFVQAPWVKKTC
ncbi:MAG: alpha/beta fold hydrolase, partial [Bacteroidota bacterium]